MSPKLRDDHAVRSQPSSGECVYLSPQEFADLTGLSIATIRRYLRSGRLAKTQLGGRGCRVLIPADALKSFPKNTAQQAAPAPPTAAEDRPTQQTQSEHPGPTPRWKHRQ